MTADADDARRALALADLDAKVAELRAQLSLVTPADYAAMRPYEQRFVDSARRAVAAYDADAPRRRQPA